MELDRARELIDELDGEILKLFLHRMELCRAIAEDKGRSARPIRDIERENEILEIAAKKSGELAPYSKELFKTMMAQSRAYQRELLERGESFALLGASLERCFSRRVRKMLGAGEVQLLEVNEPELEHTLQYSGIKGFGIETPYKRLATEFCHELSDTARDTGCVDTVLRQPDGMLCGHNTGAKALELALKRAGIELSGRRVLVLGSGGASLTAQFVARKSGALRIDVVSRTGAADYDDLLYLSDSEVIINATPVGMYPDCSGMPLSLELFPECVGVFDFAYKPLCTRLVAEARRRGIKSSGGLAMLVYQAKREQELFSGSSISGEQTERVIAALNMEMRNIVIIGMPGSGKSSIARELAVLSGKELYSVDDNIARNTGMSAGEIIRTYGEPYFRRLEHEQIVLAGARNGAVIDTGGGSVTVADNLPPMRQNGSIYRIERDLDLLVLDDRPLSGSRQNLEALGERRDPMYRAFADASIQNSGTIAQAAQRIWEDFCEHNAY